MTAAAGSIDFSVADGIATVLINNPRKRNCFTPEMFDQLHAAACAIEADQTIRAVILRGAGDKAFSAGADIDSITGGEDYLSAFLAAEKRMNRATEALSGLAVPVIAGLRGACMGGGVQVAVTADIRVVADDLRFAVPAVGLGVMYPLAPIEQLTRLAGPGAVKKLMMEGGEYDAAAALAAGFVEEVVPAAAFEDRLAALARTIADHPPTIVRAYKRIIDNIASGDGAANEDLRKTAEQSGALTERLSEVAARRRRARAAE